MTIPKSINQAVLAIWGTIIASAIVAVFEKKMGYIDSGELALSLIIYAILCILPYKISRCSNAARYTFTILTALCYLLMLADGMVSTSKADFVLTIILIPVDIFIIYRLFSGEATSWFSQIK